MKVTVLSKMYNEEDLAPFFLRHYSWADEILILLDEGTNDRTVDILKEYSNAKIIWSKSTGKMDDLILIDEINAIVRECDSDWLILLDSDEFIFPKDFAPPRLTLHKADGNVIWASMWQVYQHQTEADLDYSKPSVMQRRHGDPNRTEGFNALYTKPIIADPKTGIQWGVGNHAYHPNEKLVPSTTVFDGAHWTLPSISIAIKRRILGRKNRFSEREFATGMGGQHFHITPEKIVAEYEQHKTDPQLF